VLASVPFVPPTDAYRVRLYAATIPFFVILPGLGLSFLQEKIPLQALKPRSIPLSPSYLSEAFSIILIVLMIASPLLIKTNGRLPAPPTTACPVGMDSFFTRYDKGISINIRRENEIFLDWMPNFHISGFRRNAHNLPDSNLISIMDSIAPLNTLFNGLDLQNNSEAIIVVETDLLPEPGNLILLCGELSYDPEVTPYRVFYAEQVIPIQGP
jgi:hypothetical protein